MNRSRSLVFLALLAFCSASPADDGYDLQAHYLANAGVMVAQGSSKVLFDPFFRNDYGVYDLVPAELEEAIFMGAAPFGGIDAVFISHQHDDHFDPALIVAYLDKWQDVELYAPQQAVDQLLVAEPTVSESVLSRINGLDLEADSAAVEINSAGLTIEAVRVAHAGWPSRHTHIANVAFRVTLGPEATVVHLGDADKGREHYEPQREFWEAGDTRLAFAPIWLFLTEPGQYVLEEFVGAKHAIGVHVDDRVPDDPEDRPPMFEDIDLFAQPGEIRIFD